ncbi:MAG: DNA repair protein RecN [Clostridiales bacterium]|nr:DNA repair protein RecN [Clostridiales bacterium]
MIESLSIKNVVLIEQADIELSPALNIISGETGAGKSMLLDSLGFILGAKPQKDFVRAGCDEASVECAVRVTDENAGVLLEMGIDAGEDSLILIRRVMDKNGKASCKINGKTVTAGMVKEISALLFDIHSQHEHQNLLNPAKHIGILDKFCEEELAPHKSALSALLAKLRALTDAIGEIGGDPAERAQRMEIYAFQIEEIETAAPEDGEDERLSSRRKFLENARRAAEKADAAIENLSGEGGAASLLRRAAGAVSALADIDDGAQSLFETAAAAVEAVSALAGELAEYRGALDFDGDAELDSVLERLDTLYKLKRKYGRGIPEVLKFLEETREKLDFLSQSGEKLRQFGKYREKLLREINAECAKMSEIRRRKAEALSGRVTESLAELGMASAKFEIAVEKRDNFTHAGADSVEFLIAANIGDSLKPLAKIASGGEISRVMLAIKAVLADADTVETFVFDEIDVGVSGRAAQKVAEQLSALSKRHQLLCITHLPQIAAQASAHFVVEKSADGEKTTTRVWRMSEKEIVEEIARLIGGAKITEATIKAAAELRQMAGS